MKHEFEGKLANFPYLQDRVSALEKITRAV